ncbi:hypothetical protein EKO04_000013 [Ascochyta lentis]|uniref:Kinesin light chain n=1 Tax=Ascochyta lentis TaxID=205686 RepID=A0A8H7JEA4_9PLEO|nr:hypothetical protein EKO04_000013 [Ascochyta lentis]
MDGVGAQALLRNKLGKESGESATAELAKDLEYMPLAIVQAVAYIRQRASRCSVQQYLAEFHKSDQKKTSLLEYDGGRFRRDADAKNAILLTWRVSFDHIRQVRPSAADMLSLMSFFDRQGFPAELLRDRYWTESYSNDAETISPEGEGSDSGTSDSEESIDDGFEDDILMLRSYSIIALTTDGTAFDMHRLVQLATRRWLEEQGQLEMWKERYIDRICAAFPKEFYKDWTQYQALYPHAKLALSQAPKSEESSKRWALLLYHAAWYALDIGNLSDAEKLSMRSLNVGKEVFGETYSDTLKSMSLVLDVLVRRGRYVEAEELVVQAVETGKRMLGDDHSSTLVSMDMLARTYENQGRWKEIEELQVQAIETKKRTLGDEHPNTLLSMISLAFAYGKQGRLKEAEELEMQSVEAMKRVLGDEHPKTLFSMSELMSIRSIQGRWKEAEELSVQIVKINAKMLGWKHPSTLFSVNMLAINLRDQDRNVEAIRLMYNVVKVGRLVLGPEHPNNLFASSVLERWWREDTESKNIA